jgi:hypothetical protein
MQGRLSVAPNCDLTNPEFCKLAEFEKHKEDGVNATEGGLFNLATWVKVGRRNTPSRRAYPFPIGAVTNSHTCAFCNGLS